MSILTSFLPVRLLVFERRFRKEKHAGRSKIEYYLTVVGNGTDLAAGGLPKPL